MQHYDKPTDRFWWEYEGDERAISVFRSLETYDGLNSALTMTNLRCLRAYMNRDTSALSVSNYLTTSTQDGLSLFGNYAGRPDRASVNVIKSVIDTLVSKVGKNKIKPSFLTTGGTLNQKTRAKKMNQFIYGHMQETRSDEQYKAILRNACTFGTGLRKTLMRNGRIVKEVVFPDEIVVDPADAYYGNPISLHHRKFVSKTMLANELAKDDKQLFADIMAIKPVSGFTVGPNANDMIVAVESWKLPTDGTSGVHTLSVRGINLLARTGIKEDWKHKRFPIAKMYFTPPLLGYWGQGVCEELFGIQSELNRLMFHAQECLRLMAFPRIFYDTTTTFNPAHFVNGIGTFVPYRGPTPPTVSVAQAVGPEVFAQIESLYQKAFQQVGISQLSSQATKPAGLNSGKALREYNDIETERFASFVQMFEQFVIDDCEISLMLMPDDYVVSTMDRTNGLKKMVWSDIKLPKDEMTMQVFPVSALPNSPAAKLETVIEMKNEGLIDPDTAADLLDYPDLDSQTQIRIAPVRLVIQQIESILLEGREDVTPEPFQPIPLAKKFGNFYQNWARLNDFPESRIELVRQYVEDCIAIEQLGQQQEAFTPAAQMQQAQLQAPVTEQAVPGQVLSPQTM